MVSKGDLYKCDVCGVVCVVDEICGCAECDLIYCGTPMKKAGRKTAKKKAPRKRR